MGFQHPYRSGGGSVTGWRPADWLNIPEPVAGEEVIYLLCSIYPYNNYVAFVTEGDYTVDWGYGVVESFASGAKAEKNILWSNIVDETSEGFRQCLIKITPQQGQHITRVDFQQVHSEAISGKSLIYVDMVLSVPYVTGDNFKLGGGEPPRLVRRLWIKSIGNITNGDYLFFGFASLEEMPVFNTSSLMSMNNAFSYCRLRSLQGFDFSSTTYWFQAFRYSTVEFLDLTIPAATTFYYCFVNDPVIKEVVLRNCENITQNSYSFQDAHNLRKALMYGIKISIRVDGTNMDAQALNDLFESLPDLTGQTTRSVNVIGTPGAFTCDTTIATNKNWTVLTS